MKASVIAAILAFTAPLALAETTGAPHDHHVDFPSHDQPLQSGPRTHPILPKRDAEAAIHVSHHTPSDPPSAPKQKDPPQQKDPPKDPKANPTHESPAPKSTADNHGKIDHAVDAADIAASLTGIGTDIYTATQAKRDAEAAIHVSHHTSPDPPSAPKTPKTDPEPKTDPKTDPKNPQPKTDPKADPKTPEPKPDPKSDPKSSDKPKDPEPKPSATHTGDAPQATKGSSGKLDRAEQIASLVASGVDMATAIYEVDQMGQQSKRDAEAIAPHGASEAHGLGNSGSPESVRGKTKHWGSEQDNSDSSTFRPITQSVSEGSGPRPQKRDAASAHHSSHGSDGDHHKGRLDNASDAANIAASGVDIGTSVYGATQAKRDEAVLPINPALLYPSASPKPPGRDSTRWNQGNQHSDKGDPKNRNSNGPNTNSPVPGRLPMDDKKAS